MVPVILLTVSIIELLSTRRRTYPLVLAMHCGGDENCNKKSIRTLLRQTHDCYVLSFSIPAMGSGQGIDYNSKEHVKQIYIVLKLSSPHRILVPPSRHHN